MHARYNALINSLVDYYDVSFTDAEKMVIDIERPVPEEPIVFNVLNGNEDLTEIIKDFKKQLMKIFSQLSEDK